MKALNIFIVDDSATTRTYITKNLEVAQVPIQKITTCTNGKEAWDLLQTSLPDLMFLDINMPVMTGIELMEKVAQAGMAAKMAVVIISSEGNAQRIEKLTTLGVKKFLRKPFTPELFSGLAQEFFGVGG